MPADRSNFLLWGEWGGTIVRKPLLTEKISGGVRKTLLGEGFCVVVANDYHVYSWGASKQGCLGLGNETMSSIDPCRLAIDEPVVDVQVNSTASNSQKRGPGSDVR